MIDDGVHIKKEFQFHSSLSCFTFSWSLVADSFERIPRKSFIVTGFLGSSLISSIA
ncbi:hypothetical protein LEP1GSC035_4693 [Leptospira noguchii str. 2007001578]|uniref:Uncharacterized protein n=1 Tax=Leptospira noguchii str. 2007001578 TaxID=1049974 RepID=A0ABN0J2F9_9LEPT|nr:hypothetical protein LEP1GSC035_4693 [Leptospira noguchii str. 2007001578]